MLYKETSDILVKRSHVRGLADRHRRAQEEVKCDVNNKILT
jgi:hypothetical protein